jgi:hypothetical protein
MYCQERIRLERVLIGLPITNGQVDMATILLSKTENVLLYSMTYVPFQLLPRIMQRLRTG